jgi:iron only hydrogenase large subunit-like protein
MEDGTTKTLEKAKITLADCLACSGCVTTAESILVEAQSVSEFLRVLNRTENGPKLVVVSISPQTLASLATTCSMTMTQAYYRLNTLFSRHYRASYIFDITHAREIALIESATEFVKTFQNSPSSLPLLASSCPGWICYAEKNSNSDVLQHISTVKSPQQIMGSLVKNKLSSLHPDISPSDIYHVTLMPCWDKKLEASRQDFYSDVYRSHDVDLVLTSIEMPQLLSEAGVTRFEDLEETPITNRLFNSLDLDEATGLERVVGVSGTSGSFAEFIFKYAAKELFSEEIGIVEMKTLIRPKGVKEMKLVKDGQTLLSFATAYGFSNIANVVKQVKQGNSKYQYIEVMACPSGCLNGGGQLKSDSLSSVAQNSSNVTNPNSMEGVVAHTARAMTSRELLAAVEATFSRDQIVRLDPQGDPFIAQLYQELQCDPFDEHARRMFHTAYHALEKVETKNPLSIQW